MSRISTHARRLFEDEAGAGYSVSVLLILPIYILSLAFAVELLFIAKGYMVLHTSEGAAMHAVRVWAPQRAALARSGDSLNAQVHEAVVRSMLPFASMGKFERANDSRLQATLEATDLTPKAVDRFGQNYASLKELVSVQLEPTQNPQAGYLVTIRYQVPLYFSFFAPIFATDASDDGPVRVIEAKRYVPLPRSQFRTTEFGIPYSVSEVERW